MLLSPWLRTNGLFRLAPSNISPQWAQRRHGFGLHAPLRFSADWSINGRVSSNHVANFCTVSVSFARQSSSFHEELPSEPLWLRLLKDIIWSVRSLFSFLAEQPRQLKYIEWPSFTSTLRTATLSLFLVAVFIVALSSVDAALCYVLTVILRKAA